MRVVNWRPMVFSDSRLNSFWLIITIYEDSGHKHEERQYPGHKHKEQQYPGHKHKEQRIAFLSESTQVSEASGSIDMSDVAVLGSWPTVCVAAERSSRIAPLRGLAGRRRQRTTPGWLGLWSAVMLEEHGFGRPIIPHTLIAFRSIGVSSSVKAFSTFNDSRAEVSIKKVPSFSAKAFASSIETAPKQSKGIIPFFAGGDIPNMSLDFCVVDTENAFSTFNDSRADVSIKQKDRRWIIAQGSGLLLIIVASNIYGFPLWQGQRIIPYTSTAFRSIDVSSSVKAFSTFNDSRVEVSIKKVPSFSAKAFVSSVETTLCTHFQNFSALSAGSTLFRFKAIFVFDELAVRSFGIGWICAQRGQSIPENEFTVRSRHSGTVLEESIAGILEDFVCDALDGWFARKFNQVSTFGAVLDMVTDRISTACLLVILSQVYRPSLIFLSLLALDIGSHWLQMYSSFLAGKTSHKDVKDSSSWLFRTYYGNRKFMAYCCVSCEVLYILLFLLAENQTENLTDVLINSAKTSWLYFSLLSLLLFGWATKQLVNFIQMKTAADACVHYDIARKQ
nr:probable CDP-diacylglycerol--inositol 3-phosphatidyltransferase 2 [Ipomoea batatas]